MGELSLEINTREYVGAFIFSARSAWFAKSSLDPHLVLCQSQPSASSSLRLGVPPDGLFPPLPRTVRAEQSSITTKLRRCPAGEGRGEGDSCSPRFSLPPVCWPTRFYYPPHPALSHRNLSGSAERYTGRTRSVPGERGRERSDVLKQPDDAYFGDELQSNPKSKI